MCTLDAENMSNTRIEHPSIHCGFRRIHPPPPQGTLTIFDKRAKSLAEIALPGPHCCGCNIRGLGFVIFLVGPHCCGCIIRDGLVTIAEQSRKTLYAARPSHGE
jgi:hypothetical protein